MTQLDTPDPTIRPADIDPFQRVVDALDANFGTAPTRRAAHAKGVVVTGTFTPTPDARAISVAGHFAGERVPVIGRFSNFPGGSPHPDAAPESNPRGLAVQFRLFDGSTTDLLAHSINGFPGRTVDDFSDFLEAIAPGGPGPEGYLAEHAAAAKFVTRSRPTGHRPATPRSPTTSSTRSDSTPLMAPPASVATPGCPRPEPTCSVRTRQPPRRRTSWRTSWLFGWVTTPSSSTSCSSWPRPATGATTPTTSGPPTDRGSDWARSA